MLAEAAELPWDKILGGGSTGIAVVMCWLFLRNQTEMRKEHNATLETVAKEAARAVEAASNQAKAAADNFAATAERIHQECHASHAQAQQALHDLVKQHLER